jgi:hypothetical protein
MPVSRFISIVIVFGQRFVGISKPQGRLLAQLWRPRVDGGNHRQGEIAAVERLRNRTKPRPQTR